VLEPLACRGWTAVAYDQRGQYESPGPTRSRRTVAAFAQDLLEVAAGLGDPRGGALVRRPGLPRGGAGLGGAGLASPPCSARGRACSRHRDKLAMHAALPHVPRHHLT
jgi:hypothetical protein